ncbi:MAG: Pyruvate/2-oxoglutarate dehydrogenase complex dehydrogenase component [Actinomycetia bacterium]|nr:Pyruvate/2-oxoglutarate dehydrogenase complex dehydrogenase component [Actinomycetes bacterium]
MNDPARFPSGLPRTLGILPDLLAEMYRRMLVIRRFEETAGELHRKGEIPGPIHLSIGQEAEIVGTCLAVRNDDFMSGNHRSHGHPIGKGAAVPPLMAELMGKAAGVCKGKGGSMHLADFAVGSLGESGIVGSSVPVAVGAGLSAQLRGTDQVSIAFFGDGAVNIGAFHEGLNLASVWKLPVVFVCENNGYAVTTPSSSSSGGADISGRAAALGVPAVLVDGQNCVAVWHAASAAVERARAGLGPTLIDAQTYRYRDHSEMGRLDSTVTSYRDELEVEEWRRRDPLTLHRQVLAGVMSDEAIRGIEAAAQATVDDATVFARQSPFPQPDDAFDDLYAHLFPVARTY